MVNNNNNNLENSIILAFNSVDTSKVGYIDISELGKLLRLLGHEPTRQTIVSALFELDTLKKNGRISFDDFRSFYKSQYEIRKQKGVAKNQKNKTKSNSKTNAIVLPPRSFCFGKPLERDSEGAASVLKHRESEPVRPISSQSKKTTRPSKFNTMTKDGYKNSLRSASKSKLPSARNTIKHQETLSSSALIEKKSYSMGETKKKLLIVDPGILNIAHKLKAEIIKGGFKLLMQLKKQFQQFQCSTRQGYYLSTSGGLKNIFKQLNFQVSEKDLRLLFECLDIDHHSSLEFNDFLLHLHDHLSSTRRQMISQTFHSLDPTHQGMIDVTDMVEAFDASHHPDFLTGSKTLNEIKNEFLDTFEISELLDGKVYEKDFIEYYTSVSFLIKDDQEFEKIVYNVWGFNKLQEINKNTNHVNLIKDDTIVKQLENMKTSFSLPYETTKKTQTKQKITSNFPGKCSSEQLKPNKMKQTTSLLMFMPPPAPPQSYGRKSTQWESNDTTASLFSSPSINRSTLNEDRSMKKLHKSIANVGVAYIVKKIRKEIKTRGSNALIELRKIFCSMDNTGNKRLSQFDFKKAMHEMKFNLSDKDVSCLYDYFEQDQSLCMNYEEFFQCLCDEMNSFRLFFVELALQKLDKDKSGIIEWKEMLKSYASSNHPDVQNGMKTKEQILNEFIQAFQDQQKNVGKITKDQFIHYYQQISNSIDQDDYFELMMRNVWHLSEEEGKYDTNLQFFVTSQQGQEIKNDLMKYLETKENKMNFIAISKEKIEQKKIDQKKKKSIKTNRKSMLLQAQKKVMER